MNQKGNSKKRKAVWSVNIRKHLQSQQKSTNKYTSHSSDWQSLIENKLPIPIVGKDMGKQNKTKKTNTELSNNVTCV